MKETFMERGHDFRDSGFHVVGWGHDDDAAVMHGGGLWFGVVIPPDIAFRGFKFMRKCVCGYMVVSSYRVMVGGRV